MLAPVGEMLDQPAFRLVRRAHRQQLVGPLVDLGDLQAELVGVDHILVALIAESERVFEDPAGGARDARLTRHRVGDQLTGPSEQMRCAGLIAWRW